MSTPTSWDTLPLTLDCHDMAAILRVQVSTIWRRCSERRMRPKPFTWTRPYRWSREAVRAELERTTPRMSRATAQIVEAQVRDVSEVNAALSKALQERLS